MSNSDASMVIGNDLMEVLDLNTLDESNILNLSNNSVDISLSDNELEEDVNEDVNLCKLESCFHYVGEFPNFIVDSKNNLLAKSRLVAKDSMAKQFYWPYVIRVTPLIHYCAICNDKIAAHNNKKDNVVSHIKKKHFDEVVMLYKYLPKHFIAKEITSWDKALALSERQHLVELR